MIYLKLFLTFLKIGATTFGGGYAMIPIMREAALSNGWLTDGELMNFIAVAESTPGPIAINMATFVGSSQGGIFGSACATLGVVLPSFVIIILIASLIRRFLEYRGVKAALLGIKPVVVGLILAASVTMGLSLFFAIDTLPATPLFDYMSAILFALLFVISYGYKKWRKKAISPILLIVLAGIYGIAVFL